MPVRTAKIDLGSGYALVARANAANLNEFRLSIHAADGTELDFCTGSNNEAALYPITVCYRDGALTATYADCCLTGSSAETGDPFVYLESTAGTSHFDNFDFRKHRNTEEPTDPNCDTCGCPTTCNLCDPPAAPSVVIVDFSDNSLAGPGNCHCADFDGEFALVPGMTGCQLEPPGACVWYFIWHGFCTDPQPAEPCACIAISSALVAEPAPGVRVRWAVFVRGCAGDFGELNLRMDYYSDYFAVTECNVFPRTLTRDIPMDALGGPCTGTYASTITLEAA